MIYFHTYYTTISSIFYDVMSNFFLLLFSLLLLVFARGRTIRAVQKICVQVHDGPDVTNAVADVTLAYTRNIFRLIWRELLGNYYNMWNGDEVRIICVHEIAIRRGVRKLLRKTASAKGDSMNMWMTQRRISVAAKSRPSKLPSARCILLHCSKKKKKKPFSISVSLIRKGNSHHDSPKTLFFFPGPLVLLQLYWLKEEWNSPSTTYAAVYISQEILMCYSC
jgi:hypothetical protein